MINSNRNSSNSNSNSSNSSSSSNSSNSSSNSISSSSSNSRFIYDLRVSAASADAAAAGKRQRETVEKRPQFRGKREEGRVRRGQREVVYAPPQVLPLWAVLPLGSSSCTTFFRRFLTN
ncbi:hypothetical protein ACSSS7_003605 [Eimeria intestinalis]